MPRRVAWRIPADLAVTGPTPAQAKIGLVRFDEVKGLECLPTSTDFMLAYAEQRALVVSSPVLRRAVHRAVTTCDQPLGDIATVGVAIECVIEPKRPVASTDPEFAFDSGG